MKTKNIHIKDSKDDKNYIYCGRGKGHKWDIFKCTPLDKGYFGNPIPINKSCIMCDNIHKYGGDTLKCYEEYLLIRIENDPEFKEHFYKLKGKTLVCFCKPQKCHTDIMIKILDK